MKWLMAKKERRKTMSNKKEKAAAPTPEEVEAREKNYKPPFWMSVTVILFLLGMMALSIFVLDQHLHVTMLIVIGVTMILLVATKCPYSLIEKGIVDGAKLAIPTILILYAIGCLMGSWIASGTVPMIIYWGLKLISPKIFLVTSCFACILTSMATGSSWSTIGTVGVALVGVGMGLGVHPGLTAGAIISGAAFGDKMSPLSDTTNVAPAVAEGDLFDHIKAMIVTTGPAIVIAIIAYLIIGFNYGGNVSNETVTAIQESLQSTFKLNILTLIPPVFVIVMAIWKKPSFPTLLAAAFIGAVLAMLLNGQSLTSIENIMENGYVSETGFYDIDKLLSRGGLMSMNYNAALTAIVIVFGSLVERTGILDTCLSRMKALTRTDGMLVLTTVLTAILINFVVASQYMSIVLTGRLFVGEYKKKRYLPQCLSRTLEDSGTVTSLLIPWNLCGAFAAGALGIATLEYVPFAFFNLLCPVIAVIYGFLGKFQWKTGDRPSVRTYDEPIEHPVDPLEARDNVLI